MTLFCLNSNTFQAYSDTSKGFKYKFKTTAGNVLNSNLYITYILFQPTHDWRSSLQLSTVFMIILKIIYDSIVNSQNIDKNCRLDLQNILCHG